MKQVKVFWTLRGRTVVNIPDDVDQEDRDVLQDALYGKIEEVSTEEFQEDSDGYEIDDWEEVEA